MQYDVISTKSRSESKHISQHKDQVMSINPELASGFRDYLPEEMIPRQKMFDTIRATFERFGFVPLDTPALEREEVLTGGDPNFKMHIYRAGLRIQKDVAPGEEVSDDEYGLALHFDLTVPLARVVARYQQQIQKPFKRYQVGKVWRGEKPQAGRFREFVQFDADIVGSESMMADAEIVAVMYETLSALGVPKFLIRVNNRKVLNGLAEYAGFDSAQTPDVLRVIDKLDKQGWEMVQDELVGEVGLAKEQALALKRFIDLNSDTQLGTLDAVEQLMANSPVALEGIRELREITEHVTALEVPADQWMIDLSVARGLGYYTGPVFEAILTDLPGIGSVFSGGRYDDLVARFTPVTVPAVGASVGVDRLFAALEQLGLLKKQSTVASVMILNFDPTASTACERVATQLRRVGISTEIYMGRERTLRAQISYAVSKGVSVVILIGSTELESGTVQIRDLKTRTQSQVEEQEVSALVQQLLIS
jgi:histidyl-tRNA synthetase